MSTNMTFGVETSTHRPKYRLWLGLYIITIFYFCGAAAGALLSPALPAAFSDAAALF